MQIKAVNKVIATILLFAVAQALACMSPFITLHQGPKTNHDHLLRLPQAATGV